MLPSKSTCSPTRTTSGIISSGAISGSFASTVTGIFTILEAPDKKVTFTFTSYLPGFEVSSFSSGVIAASSSKLAMLPSKSSGSPASITSGMIDSGFIFTMGLIMLAALNTVIGTSIVFIEPSTKTTLSSPLYGSLRAVAFFSAL